MTKRSCISGKKVMKKINISAINNYIFASTCGVIISAVVLLTPSIAYATDSDQLECPDLSNEILKRQNAGTFFKPVETKIEYLKNSLQYTQSLKTLYAEEKKIQKLKDDFNASPAMQHLMKNELHFDHVIKFTTNGNETEFIYNGNSLIAISSRNKATDKKANSRGYKETKEDVLILNDCQISKIAHITTLNYPKQDEIESEVQLVPSALCKDLHKIKRLALAINDDVDDFKYNCQQKGGVIIINDTAKDCKCYHTGKTFDPYAESCGNKQRHITTPSWKIFEKFISDHGGNWQHGTYTRKTYYEIEKKCSEYTQYFEAPESVIKSARGEKSENASKVIQK